MTARRATLKRVPGYQIRNRVAIYGSGHHSRGAEVWSLWMRFLARYPNFPPWLVFGDGLSFENRYRDGTIESVEEAHCTGLDRQEKSGEIEKK